ncbi:glutathione S-transferase family protein [Pleionea sediminis]|uniref:glutathione S-transferase family protein n=1 Tax=Pleionea sediminis TaxID=2569479 RepID=UPI001185C78F|nr:glutathione S-transferase N-terminal domain-containing protein [Pleionea sediminis]
MKLFISTASPYARTAQVVLREVGLDPKLIESETHPFNNEQEFLRANPLGKVPCMLLDDGSSIYDSEVICQYLDFEFNQEKLWQPIMQSWSLRTLYSHVSGLLDLAVALRQEKMREEEKLRSDFWWSRFESGLLRGFSFLENNISRLPNDLSLLHINLTCLVDYMSFRHSDIKLKCDQVNQLCLELKSRQSFKATEPKG